MQAAATGLRIRAGGLQHRRKFLKELDTSSDVLFYAKIPHDFLIPKPLGDYNSDWAFSFKEGTIKQVHFVAETKGSMSTIDLREIKKT